MRSCALLLVSAIYQRVLVYLTERFSVLSDIFRFLPLSEVFPTMAGAALGLGAGIGFLVSYVTICRNLRA